MLTPSHGAIAHGFNILFNRFRKKKISALYIILGALIPDIGFLINWRPTTNLEHLHRHGSHYEHVLLISRALHSIPIFAGVLAFAIIFRFIKFPKVQSFLIGWGVFHLVIDTLTHATNQPYFWPWKMTVRGFLDHGRYPWLVIDIFITFIWFVCLCRKFFKKKNPR